jgi:hypothetical protein
MCTPNISPGNSCQVYRGKKGIKVPYFEGKRKKGKVQQVRSWLYKMSTQYNKVPPKKFYFALHTMYPNVKHFEAKIVVYLEVPYYIHQFPS